MRIGSFLRGTILVCTGLLMGTFLLGINGLAVTEKFHADPFNEVRRTLHLDGEATHPTNARFSESKGGQVLIYRRFNYIRYHVKTQYCFTRSLSEQEIESTNEALAMPFCSHPLFIIYIPHGKTYNTR